MPTVEVRCHCRTPVIEYLATTLVGLERLHFSEFTFARSNAP
ncbi:MAG: hypothetical protein AVDCRST_MAG86-3898 [uncultured Truepera sp.]|uniref:Uncharacterized protein n=1 Tax=uncultured Truepera sp. TaxID=543023 RepID=A0A6J4VSG5_9DEIN|nr:MAG: hypothetical protein AVDCRST_MAG86-3898 [uncultured Truepera sp.]